MNSTVTVLSSLLALGLGQPAFGSCTLGEPNRVATVILESCVELPHYAANRLKGTQLPWVVHHIYDVLDFSTGVVVAGTVTRKVHVTQYSESVFEIEGVQLADERGEWFVALGSEATCSAYPSGTEVELYVVDKCCDVIPPSDIPCLLDTGQAWPVPPGLKKLL